MIAVTGASGFVGSALVSRLLAEQFATRALLRARCFQPFEGAELIETGDLESFSDWAAALAGVRVVVHTAARVHLMNDSAKSPLDEFRRINVETTLELARQAAKMGVERFVFLSSIKVNGEVTTANTPFSPDDEPAPVDAYGISKWEAECGLRQLASQVAMKIVIVRPPLVYGPSAKANFANLARIVKRGLPLPFGAINNQRSLVGLDNLVDFVLTCIVHPKAVNQIFLVSDGHDLSTADLVRGLAVAAGVRARLISVPPWALKFGARAVGASGMVNRLCDSLQVDLSKATSTLGWIPPVSVTDGLSRAMAGLNNA